MDIITLERTLPKLLDMSVDTDKRISIELFSAPGRGKSQLIKSLVSSGAERTGQPWGLATCFLATQTPSGLLGFGIPERDERGRLRTQYTMPAWYQTVDGATLEDYSRGILFLDEFGQGEADVKRASAELLLNGQLGPWRVPPGWTVIAASNRASDRSGVTKSFDFIINRRLEIHLTDSIDAWMHWAEGMGLHPVILHFAKQNPHIVFTDGVPEKQGPWCTPRSLEKVCHVLEAIRPEGMPMELLPSDTIALELACGLIGEPAAVQLFASIRLAEEMPALDEIERNPLGVKVPTKLDACYLIAMQLSHHASKGNIRSFTQYVDRMPPEFGFMFIKATTKRLPAIVTSPDFAAWAAKSATMNAAIGAAATR